MGWQPISSAPKDGTAILAWNDDEAVCQIVEWLNDGEMWLLSDGGFTFDLTHWMPLPEPPTA